MGPTGYADSPYQTLSTFAGNTMLISFDSLREDSLLREEDLQDFPAFPEDYVEYGPVLLARSKILHKVAQSFGRRASPAFKAAWMQFCEEESKWLEDYTLFAALKKEHGGGPWIHWPEPLRRREPTALTAARKKHSTEIKHSKILQFLFFRQWNSLREDACKRGISLIGDIPIFVAHDSADVWCHPELFFLDAKGNPTVIAGVPPDYFSATGQRWGNPLYRWDIHEKDGFSWWIDRLRSTFRLYDIVRIDHFRGFESFWEIPAQESTAIHGRWMKGPGRKLFDAAHQALGPLPILAEDLGVITPEGDALRDELGFPGMRILQFAFGDGPQPESFRPESYPSNCAAYTGTHDNDTTVGWYRSEPGKDSTRNADQISREQHNVRRYLSSDGSQIHWDLIGLALRSHANTAIYPLQDVLGLGSTARMNIPGREQGNWSWRFRWEQLSPDIEQHLHRMAWEAGRA
jgi:4-alpha-glucanotransferase